MSTNDNRANSSPSPSPPTLPPVDPPPVGAAASAQSRNEVLAFDPDLLDHNVRRLGAYGALLIATLLYILGVMVVMKQMSLWPWDCTDITQLTPDAANIETCSLQLASVREGWHSFVAAMVALFSVPTVLVIAVLRSVTSRKDPGADTVYNVLGEKIVSILEKWVGGKH